MKRGRHAGTAVDGPNAAAATPVTAAPAPAPRLIAPADGDGVPAAVPDDDTVFDLELRLLLEALYLRYRHDFRDYAVASLRRRIPQAMAQLGCATMAALQHRVLHEPAVVAPLLQYLTVQVSDLFRDPPYYLALRREVVPVLQTYPSIKVWVAGCSSGEEVWSLAILLHEEGLLDRAIVYATDIHPGALQAAQSGVYPLDRMAAFSRNYQAAGGHGSLSDHYTSAYGGAVFDRRLRENIVFADHSLATDSVFSEMHLISCRNVLIYFQPQLQDRAIGLFRESLVHRGFLGLGSHETLEFGAHAEAFSLLPGTTRLFRLR